MGFLNFFCCTKKPQQDLANTYADASRYYLEYLKQTRVKHNLDGVTIKEPGKLEEALKKFLSQTEAAGMYGNNSQLMYRRATVERALAVLNALNPQNQLVNSLPHSDTRSPNYKKGITTSESITPANAQTLLKNIAEGLAEGQMQRFNIFTTSRAERVYKNIAKSVSNMTDKNLTILKEAKEKVNQELKGMETKAETNLTELQKKKDLDIQKTLENNYLETVQDAFSASGSTGKGVRNQLNHIEKTIGKTIEKAQKNSLFYKNALLNFSSLFERIWTRNYKPVEQTAEHPISPSRKF